MISDPLTQHDEDVVADVEFLLHDLVGDLAMFLGADEYDVKHGWMKFTVDDMVAIRARQIVRATR